MSESRDNDDKGGKMIKDSDVHQEEQVSTEGNASFSTPLEETATQTEGSADKMTEKPSGEGNVDLPFHKLTTHDDDDTISQSKSGGGSSSSSEKRANQELQNTDDQFHREAFFELQLTQNDVEQDSLYIPKQTAAEHFPRVPIDKVQGDIIDGAVVISDTQNQNWDMTLFYIRSLGAFLIAGGWHDFAVRHNLKARDVICFCRPLSHLDKLNLQEAHFLIECVKRAEAASGTSSGQNDQLGGAENDDDGGDYWGDRASSGKHAGPSPHCGSPRNNQPGGRKRAIKALEEFLKATVSDWEAMVLITQLLNSKK